MNKMLDIWINKKQVHEFEQKIIVPYIKISPKMFNFVDPKFYIDPSCPIEDQVQYFLIMNAINFRYWSGQEESFDYAQGMKRDEVFRGSSYMVRCLKLWLDANPKLLSAEYLQNLPFEEFQAAFADDRKNNILPDLEQRLLNLHDLGDRLTNIKGGKFATILFDIGKTTDDHHVNMDYYLPIIQQFRAYDDPLAKLAMVNAIVLQMRGLAHFSDIWPGIDYHLCNMLFRLGILECTIQLQHDLETRTPISPETAMIIRQHALFVFLHMMKNTKISGEQLDQLFYQNKACRVPVLCNLCPFRGVCIQRIGFQFMLELNTRYY